MIIKDDKLAQAESEAEQIGETPPPYSAAPQVHIGIAEPALPSPALSQTQQNASQSRVPPSPSLASPSTAIAQSSSNSVSDAITKSQDSYSPVPPPSNVRRTSFLHLQRSNMPISERIVIDPCIPFPLHSYTNESSLDEEDENEDFGPRFGSPVPGDPDKKNVRLECKNGNVNAEIWVVGASGGSIDRESDQMSGTKKVGIDIRAMNGFVRVKMHTNEDSVPFALRIAAKNGGVRVALPRNFVGPLTTCTRNGWTTLSSALAGCVTSFSEVRGTRKSFVGDFNDSGYGRGEWFGSSLDITCDNGRVKLCFVDEDTRKATNSGLLGRFFS